MRVTEKGQVTIPKAIRDKLGIVPGTEVEFISRCEQVFLEKIVRDAAEPAERLIRHVDHNTGRFDLDGMQADEITRLLRD